MFFEILNFLLMLLGLLQSLEGPKIAALSGRLVLLTRIQTIFARFQLAYHTYMDASEISPDVSISASVW